MTCREQILEVARDLARRTPHGTFAVREIVAGMRARNTPYTEGTIYGHVTSVMRRGASRRGSHYEDLERVGRGVYRLVEPVHQPTA